jgi:photosystem II stability/assembly factor-like uncharacterized protein
VVYLGFVFCKEEMNSAKRTRAALVFAVACISVFSCKDHSTEPSLRECDPVLEAPINQWQFLGFDDESITAIEIDPRNPQTIYAGTQLDFSAGRQGKLFKSTDCGQTWDTLLVGGSYRAILVDPINHNVIYALPHAIVKSTDAGRSWRQITNGMRIDSETRVQSLVIDPMNPSILYAGTGGVYGGSLYKSADGGASWQNLYQSAEITPGLRDGVVSLAIDPKNPAIIYAGTAWRGFLVKSTNGGATWSLTGLGQTNGIVEFVAIHPRASETIYAGVGFGGLFVSHDAGASWQKESLPDSVQGSPLDLVFNSTEPSDIYLATGFGGFNKACDTCAWREMNEGLVRRSLNVLAQGWDGILYAGRSTFDDKNGGLYVRRISR